MSIQAMAWVIERSQQTGLGFVTLLMIANHANAEGKNSYPSMKTLAKECRLSTRTIQRTILKLESSGELKVDRSEGRVCHSYSLPLMHNVDTESTLPKTQRRQGVHVGRDQRGQQVSTLKESERRQSERANVDTVVVNVDSAESTDPFNRNTEPITPLPPYCGKEFLDALGEFEDSRVEMKKPLTKAGRRQLYAKLGKQDEITAAQMLSDAVLNGWRGVWRPKGESNGSGQKFETVSERNIRNLRETAQYVRQLSGEAGSEHSESTTPLLTLPA
jgi:hypothetical protein